MEITSLILSVIALIISSIVATLGWVKNRNIYDIERDIFLRNPDEFKGEHNYELREKLRSGKYTILNTGQYNDEIEIILGKLKK